MYQRQQELMLIERYKGRTPADVTNLIRKDISQLFPKSVLAKSLIILHKCNSWSKLGKKIEWLSSATEYGEQEDFINDLYSAFLIIKANGNKSFALKKRTKKLLGHFTTCPHCWRFVFKRYNKIKKDPYCCFHESGCAEYQSHRRALLRLAKIGKTPRLQELRSLYLKRTQNVLHIWPPNYINLKSKGILAPEEYEPVEHDLTEIWPHLPLTKEFICKTGGDIRNIESVISALDPVDRIDPNDMWDKNDTEGAAFVREKRLLLHQIIIRDASLYKWEFSQAEAWLKLQQEVRSSKGGPKPNAGGRRIGAGRPKKQ
ncbi:hypothetical protein SYK_14570 [Pseudodesulfovibrio nedwellii]|uniref:Uncharacterized protein n=1 Tax=Pseudodesulfovibrio nedwellii TaxID=2973072 RepID=A0ABN6S430_9BACT|nr:hypothetical protein [Pseudodesulfovibrio nedwellii]BDQ37097.1 hypothetical protein SYK_14570 [Pseudodesulfovibrio nedwellii]